ncbi:hypothetical protein PybrP1_010416, partial [[Pythium] brassicae (nom. inval.)]
RLDPEDQPGAPAWGVPQRHHVLEARSQPPGRGQAHERQLRRAHGRAPDEGDAHVRNTLQAAQRRARGHRDRVERDLKRALEDRLQGPRAHVAVPQRARRPPGRGARDRRRALAGAHEGLLGRRHRLCARTARRRQRDPAPAAGSGAAGQHGGTHHGAGGARARRPAARRGAAKRADGLQQGSPRHLQALQVRPRRRRWGGSFKPTMEADTCCCAWGLLPCGRLSSLIHSASGGVGSIASMSIAEFNKFVKDCALCDRGLTPQAAEGVFRAAMLRAPLTPHEPLRDDAAIASADCDAEAREMGGREFVDALVRIAAVKFADLSLEAQFQELMEQAVLPNALRSQSEIFRAEVAAPKLRAVFQKHKPALQRVFRYYTSMRALREQQSTLGLRDFAVFAKDCKLVGSFVTEHTLKQVLVNLQQDAAPGGEDDLRADFGDFTEAIAALTEYVICNPTASRPAAVVALVAYLPLERRHDVVQQHRDRHGADAAGHGREQPRDLARLAKVHVADDLEPVRGRRAVEAGAACRGVGVLDKVDPDVDHNGAGLEPRAAHEVRLAARGDHHVGLLHVPRQVDGLGVALDHGRVALLQQQPDGAPDEVAPADDHGGPALERHGVRVQQRDDALGGARHEVRVPVPHRELAGVERV